MAKKQAGHANGDGLRLCDACDGLCEELVDLDTGIVLKAGTKFTLRAGGGAANYAVKPTPRRLTGATKLTVQAGARGAIDTRYFCPKCSPTMQAMIDSLIEAIRITNTEAKEAV